MDVTPLVPSDRQVIDGYAPGGFVIHSQWHAGPVLVRPDRVAAWPVTAFESLTAEDFRPLADDPPDVILLGTGAAMKFLPKELKAALRALGLTVEPMDSGAACRTYNVLMAEERRVAAALLPL